MKTKKSLPRHSEGFTLIELLVVIFIIGVLTGVVLPNFMSARQRARDAKRKEDLVQIKTALRLYYNDNQSYPAAGMFSFGGSWSPYMANVPQDPLGDDNSYGYCVSSTGEEFLLTAQLENKSDIDIAGSQSRCNLSDCSHGCADLDKCYFICGN